MHLLLQDTSGCVRSSGMNSCPVLKLPSLFETFQEFWIFKAQLKYYLVAVSQSRTSFRLLKIDRSQCVDLGMSEDQAEYDNRQVETMISMLNAANAVTGGLKRVGTAYAVVGFIRFLKGHYLYIVTGRRLVGRIGGHAIYAITDTQMIYLPNEDICARTYTKQMNTDEAKYKSLFQFVDLSKNFYYSHTYDLSRTIQSNMSIAQRGLPIGCNEIFVWNQFLMDNMENYVGEAATKRWTVPLIQGFFEQQTCSVLGRPLTLTLIARRSRCYAGTRYLKRGIDTRGHSANDVESEQIVHDRNAGSPSEGQFASYTQCERRFHFSGLSLRMPWWPSLPSS
eukprot:1049642_1